MRKPERINQLMYYLNYIWKKQPDTRFNQLIHNLQYEFNSYRGNIYKEDFWRKDEHNGIVMYQKQSIVDLYNVEDELFIEFLKVKVEEWEKKEQNF